LARKTIFFSFAKSALAYYHDGVLVVSSEVVGLVPGFDSFIPLDERNHQSIGSTKRLKNEQQRPV
jgi:hypothetical protein